MDLKRQRIMEVKQNKENIHGNISQLTNVLGFRPLI